MAEEKDREDEDEYVGEDGGKCSCVECDGMIHATGALNTRVLLCLEGYAVNPKQNTPDDPRSNHEGQASVADTLLGS